MDFSEHCQYAVKEPSSKSVVWRESDGSGGLGRILCGSSCFGDSRSAGVGDLE